MCEGGIMQELKVSALSAQDHYYILPQQTCTANWFLGVHALSHVVIKCYHNNLATFPSIPPPYNALIYR